MKTIPMADKCATCNSEIFPEGKTWLDRFSLPCVPAIPGKTWKAPHIPTNNAKELLDIEL